MCEAMVSFISALIGGGLTLVGVVVAHKMQLAERDRVDEPRRQLLRQMLDNPKYEWRSMEKLSGVIGASREETARLLIEIGARRDENTDDRELWGYISRHPLPQSQ
jgi:hypothetical protein